MNTKTTSPHSHIEHDANGTFRAAVGPDATNLFRAITTLSAIRMHVNTGGRLRLTRMASPTLLLQIAGEYSGKKYKRTQFAEAQADLQKWIDTMKAALPHVTREPRDTGPETQPGYYGGVSGGG